MNAHHERLQAAFSDFDDAQFAQKLAERIKADYVKRPEMMLPTFISGTPSGKEVGRYLAIELGGSTLRAAIVLLDSSAATVGQKRSWSIDKQLKTLHSAALFDWIAHCVLEVVAEGRKELWRLGVTFSFPVCQMSIASGTIMRMGKGFAFQDNQDSQLRLETCLTLAFAKLGLRVELCAMVNDSVSLLLAQCYLGSQTAALSIILGTGCNSAALVQASSLGSKSASLGLDERHLSDLVPINCELSMFGQDILPWTSFDRAIDAASLCPAYQPLEQFTSGMYLGELVRLVWLDRCALASLSPPESFRRPYSITGGLLSRIEQDAELSPEASRILLDEAHPLAGGWDIDAAGEFRRIARLITNRSARLVAASLVALARATNHDQDEILSIPCCGALLEEHANYLETCQAHLTRLRPSSKLAFIADAGLVGAAVVAAMQI